MDLNIVSIAGINILLKSTYRIIAQGANTSYLEFLKKVLNKRQEVDVTVQIGIRNKYDTGKMKKLYESCDTWSLFTDGEDHIIEFRPTGTKEARWVARFNSGCSEVRVECGSQLFIEKDGKKSVISPFHYPLDQILIMYILAVKNGILIHAAGVEINGKAYIFPGRSGAGKSTISNLFIQRDDMEVLSDDRIIVRKTPNGFSAYGTPWPGDAGIARNISAPLAGIFFIRHGRSNSISEIRPITAIESLLPVASIQWYDKEIIPGMLDLCEDLVSNVPTYELHFKPGSEVIDVLENFIK